MSGIYVSSYRELDEKDVQANQLFQGQLLQEWHPSLTVRRGVLHDLVLYPHGILLSMLRLEMSRLRRSMSLWAALQDPHLADPEILNALASNFLISRRAGAKASGRIVVTVSQLVPITVSAGTLFETQGKSFRSPVTYMIRTSEGAVESDTDRVLNSLGDGRYSFQILVEAVAEGAEYSIRRGTTLVPRPDLPYFVSAYAAEDFVGGLDAESNSDLLARLQQGPTVRAASGRAHLVASVVAREQFASVVSHSLIGFGDPEMTRDQHSLWPGSLGGRVDWYIRPSELTRVLVLQKTATLISKDTEGTGIWQFSLSRDDFPGFYFVEQITALDRPFQIGSYEIVEDLRAVDLSPVPDLDILPDIQTATEAAYTRFQTAVIRFYDHDTQVSGLTENQSTREYLVAIRGFPLLAELQQHAGHRTFRHPGADLLVRAPVPCFVKFSATVAYSPEDGVPDFHQAAQECARKVNRLGFRGRLTAASLADTLQDVLGERVEITQLDLFGAIRTVDGTWRYLRSSDVLEIPDEPERQLTSRTTVFILDPQDVSLTPVLRSRPTF